MSQVNKYADRAAYASDTNRLSTLSAVSLIASDNELIYDGVNVVVGKDAAAAGDCAVYDKTAGAIRFVKGATLSAAQLPESLTPLAVVYARQGDKVLIISLDNVASELRWAASYEVALSGFDLATGRHNRIKDWFGNRSVDNVCRRRNARRPRERDQYGIQNDPGIWISSYQCRQRRLGGSCR